MDEKAPADLVNLRDRLKALSADILWVGEQAGVPEGGKAIASETYSLAKTVDTLIASRSKRSFGKSQDDEPLDHYLADVDATIEADRFAQHTLWKLHAEEGSKFVQSDRVKFPWEGAREGYLRCTGKFEDMECWIDLSVATIGGFRILFYYGSGVFVHHDMMRDWLEANLPGKVLRADGTMPHDDADNFVQVIHTLERERAEAGA